MNNPLYYLQLPIFQNALEHLEKQLENLGN